MADLKLNKVLKNTKYDILTDTGFQHFEGLLCGTNKVTTLSFSDGSILECTPKHKICINENDHVFTKDLSIGDLVQSIDNSKIEVVDIKESEEITDVYDFLEVANGHKYLINKVLTRQCLYLDEFAFVKPHIAEEFIASVFPTISSGTTTKVIMTSTPKGMNQFYRMWEKALGDYSVTKEGNGYVRSEIPWNAVPGRTAEWARQEKARIGEIRFNQEFLCQFIGSISTLIDHNFLRDLKPVEPMKIPKLPDCVKIWELPRNPKQIEVKNWEYVASIDSGYGIHADYTVLQICLVKSNITIHQVAKLYSNSMDIDEFCQKARNLLKCYGDPRLIIEQNGPGIAAMQFFHLKAEYEDIMHFHPTGKQMGLWATDRLKETACILLKTCVQRGFLKLKDRETIEELHSFGKTTQKKWGGLGGNHDDHVTSIYWIVYYVNTPFFYGNVVEVDMKRVSEDEYLLTTEEERSTADKVMADVRDPNFHMAELQKGAEFLPENQINGIYDENDGEGEDLGSGLMFRT